MRQKEQGTKTQRENERKREESKLRNKQWNY